MMPLPVVTYPDLITDAPQGVWADIAACLTPGEFTALRANLAEPPAAAAACRPEPKCCAMCQVPPIAPFVYMGKDEAAECGNYQASDAVCRNCISRNFNRPLGDRHYHGFHRCPWCDQDHTAAFTNQDAQGNHRPFPLLHPIANDTVGECVVDCPRGCGCFPNGLKIKDLVRHLTQDCPEREVAVCKWPGCRDELGHFPCKAKDAGAHEDSCPRRLVPCPLNPAVCEPCAFEEVDAHIAADSAAHPGAVLYFCNKLVTLERSNRACLCRLEAKLNDVIVERDAGAALAPAPAPAAAPRPAPAPAAPAAPAPGAIYTGPSMVGRINGQPYPLPRVLLRASDGGPPTGVNGSMLVGRPGASESTPDAELDLRVTWNNRKRMRGCMGIAVTDEARWFRILKGREPAPNADWKQRYSTRSTRNVRQRTDDADEF